MNYNALLQAHTMDSHRPITCWLCAVLGPTFLESIILVPVSRFRIAQILPQMTLASRASLVFLLSLVESW